MKEDGNAAFKASNWSQAHELYSQALEIDPCNKATNAKLYFNRATVAAKVLLHFLRLGTKNLNFPCHVSNKVDIS